MSRKSAFSVYKALEELKKEENSSNPGSSDDDQPVLKGIRKLGSTQNIASTTTPIPSALSKRGLKGESRFSSIRKSLRKKSRKEPHHDVSLKKQSGKENKLQKSGSVFQAFDRSNWTESMQSLNSSALEEAFLPEVVKQKKQQEELHGQISTQKDQLRSSSASALETNANKTASRKRAMSHTGTMEEPTQKPPIAKKGRVQGNKKPESPKTSNKMHDMEKDLKNSEKLFSWVIAPIKPDQFFLDVWQKKPLFIKRRQPKYNNVWFSCKEFDKILRQQNVQFTKNLDIAVYRNDARETLNPNGRAFAPVVWKFYQDGCSIRLLNPQTFSKNVWQLSSKLQEYFGCFVGSNVYLTPPGSQGFAPHYDDIEAFIIQLEGKKHWKLYASRNVNEVLPRYSSKNLSQEELGEPILDRILEPGDTLYFPRGVIHQAVTPEDSHSLHITLSFYQKYCWSDFMEKLLPAALQTAIEEDAEFRKGLPLGFHNHVGVSYSEKPSIDRKCIMKNVEQLMKKLVSYVSVDQAADELVLDQMEEFLPPSFTSEETSCTIYGSGCFWEDGDVRGDAELSLGCHVRLVRPGIVRLVALDDVLEVHHTMENSRQYKETPLQMLQIPLEMADAAEYLLFSYPEYVQIKNVPLDDDDEKLSLALKFYSAGFLRTKEPLVQDTSM